MEKVIVSSLNMVGQPIFWQVNSYNAAVKTEPRIRTLICFISIFILCLRSHKLTRKISESNCYHLYNEKELSHTLFQKVVVSFNKMLCGGALGATVVLTLILVTHTVILAHPV